ncbi:alanine/glycine:cation symporter family protein [Helicobacter burdigaliensis]|uniref:alanine/glycine:cation symporter family protein n=1 Tax=Helicobacter burdigaliensis TaxID=2315334 RepID=UPI000EF67799|nr:amino acid carrier protein [Helicobacter burdigaliensis]
MYDLFLSINEFFVTYILVGALLLVGILYTFVFKFAQIFKFKYSITYFFKNNQKDKLSSLKSLALSICAQVGVGSVVGVATAIKAGGAGAVFWMWVGAFLGMASIMAEVLLAQKFRIFKNGQYLGGPAFYIREGLKGILGERISKIISYIFALSLIVALGFIGQMTQSNAIAISFKDALGFSEILSGFFVALLCAFVIFGGVKRIVLVAEFLAPFMAVLYLLCAIYILFLFYDRILFCLEWIIISAINPEAIMGGLLGISVKEALHYGISRGLIANEAGMGSIPHAYINSKDSNVLNLAFSAMLSVFITTMLICTATALIILLTNTQNLEIEVMMQSAFNIAFGSFGGIILALCVFFFAFTTIIAWYYFARVNVLYLFDKKILAIFKILVLFFIVLGAILQIELVWELSDFFNTLMVISNVLALILLLPLVRKIYVSLL